MATNYCLRSLKCGIHAIFIIIHIPTLLGQEQTQCPSLTENPFCSCYNYIEGLRLQCPNATPEVVKNVLRMIKGTVYSLSIYDLERSTIELEIGFIPSHVIIKNLEIARSGISKVSPNAFSSIRRSLESLSIMASKLNRIPHDALKQLFNIEAIDFELNDIKYIGANDLKGLKLKLINLRRNKIANISKNAFIDLKETLTELDLSENVLETFPLLGNLYKLSLLKLNLNKINTILDTNDTTPNLFSLDLSFNAFTKIDKYWFKSMPNLKTLTLFSNEINYIDEEAFYSLENLKALNLSKNKIVSLEKKTFQRNLNIKSIDLSFNHLHHIKGLFANLNHLSDIFLNENNIFEIPDDAFYRTIGLLFLNIEQNGIRLLYPNCFDSLHNITELHIGSNFIKKLPSHIFQFNQKLLLLDLDNNELQELDDIVFDKLIGLKILRLQNNKLTHIKENVFSPMPGLEDLFLAKNVIEKIDSNAFITLTNLQRIYLYGNKLNTIGDNIFPSQNSSVNYIDLSLNNLSIFKDRFLKGQINLREISLSGNDIKKLSPSLFSDLESTLILQLKSNNITHVENRTFVDLIKLEDLDLSNNKISEIHSETFYNLVTLEQLSLKRNNIKEIATDSFQNLIQLKKLDLSENEIYIFNINISALPIKQIYLNENGITTISADSLRTLPYLSNLELKMNYLTWEYIDQLYIPRLKSLVLSNNNFTHLGNKTFSHLLSLRSLTLEMSNISHLPPSIFTQNQNLLTVNLAYNNLKDLDKDVFAFNTILQDLNLKGNRFTDFPHVALFNISSLETLNLCHNQLHSIDFYKFIGLLNLRSLNLCHNRISILYGFTSPSLEKLVTINLSNNMITILPPNFLQHSVSLKDIDLAKNLLKYIPSLTENLFPALTSLNMSSNSIEQLQQTFHTFNTIKHFSLIEELIVMNTNLMLITSVDFENFRSLTRLILSHNVIKLLSPGAFSKLHRLKLLDLSWNKLQYLPQERFQGLYSVQFVNFSRNIVRELEVFTSDFQRLEILDLSSNHITSITKDVFRNLLSLSKLYLNDNWLSVIAPGLFGKLKKIAHIDLSRNYFEVIQLKMLLSLETQIETISYDDNPLTCNCVSQELWRWMHYHHKIVLKGSSNLRCKYPEELHGLNFLELNSQKLCDIPVVIKIAIQDIQTYSVLVTWQSRNETGLKGYQVAYFMTQMPTIVLGKFLNSTARTTRLNYLTQGAEYVICVIAIGDFDNMPGLSTTNAKIELTSVGYSNLSTVFAYGDELIFNKLRLPLNDSHINKCTTVSTLDMFRTVLDGPVSNTYMIFFDFLTRRLSLIVGCCVGIIVFIICMIFLGYIKKKTRPILPINEVQPPPQYLSCENFTETEIDAQSTDLDINTISSHLSI